ncbi:MAG: cell division protein SepF [Candidatus Ventricola sp.]|nr:cell division protein SepF [Candidatus Ventricola sp.]
MNFLSSLSRKLGFTGGDEDERDEELEENELEDEEEEDDEEEGSGFSFRFPFGSSMRNKQQAVYEDEEEEPAPQPRRTDPQGQSRASSRRGNVIHDARMDPRAAQEPQYTHCERIVNVRQIEESREIIKYLLRGESILLNLENIDPKDCGRVVDLLSGAAFALQGRMIKVAHLSYLLAPENVEIIESDAYGAGRARYSR